VAVREPEPPGLTAVREAGYAVWDRRAELWARQAELEDLGSADRAVRDGPDPARQETGTPPAVEEQPFLPAAGGRGPGEWAVPLEFPPALAREDLHDHRPGEPCNGFCWPAARAAVAAADDVDDAPPADPASYEPAWEPWSLSEGTTVEEEVRAMIANANAAPSVRWLDSLEAA
jgi:hypothetical protein